jgi:hypothetical protein
MGRPSHQENNTLVGWLEMLESTRVARITRSSFNFFQKISLAESSSLVGFSRSSSSSASSSEFSHQ